MLHLRVRELDGASVLCGNLCDHPLPLVGAGTGNSRSIFLDGHLQPERECRFILVENGHNAPAVDHRNLSIEHVRNVDGLAVNCPDARRGNLLGRGLLFLLGYNPWLREVFPAGILIVLGRRLDMQCVWLQSRVEPPLIALVRIAPITYTPRRWPVGRSF